MWKRCLQTLRKVLNNLGVKTLTASTRTVRPSLRNSSATLWATSGTAEAPWSRSLTLSEPRTSSTLSTRTAPLLGIKWTLWDGTPPLEGGAFPAYASVDEHTLADANFLFEWDHLPLIRRALCSCALAVMVDSTALSSRWFRFLSEKLVCERLNFRADELNISCQMIIDLLPSVFVPSTLQNALSIANHCSEAD